MSPLQWGFPNVRSYRFLMHMGRLLMGLIGCLVLLFSSPDLANAQVHQHENEAGVAMLR